MIQKMMNKVMLSCKKATGLIDKKYFYGNKLIEKIQLKVHLMMCNGCKNYKKQSDILNNVLKSVNSTEILKIKGFSEEKLESLKKGIIKKINY